MEYIEFRNFALEISSRKSALTVWTYDGRGKRMALLSDGEFLTADGKKCTIQSFKSDPDPLFQGELNNHFWLFHIRLSGKKEVKAVIFEDRVEISSLKGKVKLRGHIRHGREKNEDLLLMKSTGGTMTLYGSCGPRVFTGSDLLYSRRSDNALKFTGKTAAFYDWEKKKYFLEATLSSGNPLQLRFEYHVGQSTFHARSWKGISRAHGFDTPPVGWMTWYALRFEACEEKVLENAAAMKKHFGPYNDKLCIWVDWEWCHAKMSYHSDEGVDVLHPRKDVYPRGLKYVSDRIREMGLIPALWTGATCDGNVNELFKKNPGYLLTDRLNWAGRYWADLSHPGVAKEYIPVIFRKLLSWGYDMIKWDCLLNTMRFNDMDREKRYDPQLTTDEAFHRVIAAGRKVLGDKVYLLGCTGMERATMAAADIFDACRIGGDVFSWEDFKNNAVIPIFSYFPMHNTSIILDPDTLVLRKEYSTLEQARSRVSLFSLTGMQLTVGDPVDQLDPQRIDAVKRAMPAVEVTPFEMCRKNFSGETAVVMTSVARPWGNWYIAGAFNLTEKKQKCRIKLDSLPKGRYTVFEFWSQRFLKVTEGSFEIELPPGGCGVYRLTGSCGVPVLAGTSRHLLQGAVELEHYSCDPAACSISGKVRVVAGDDVKLCFYAPEGTSFVRQKNLTIDGRIAYLNIAAGSSGVKDFQIKYEEK